MANSEADMAMAIRDNLPSVIQSTMSTELADSQWEDAFLAAPKAIEVMGVALGLSAMDIATSTQLKGGIQKDGFYVRPLPVKSLQGNLQVCSDMGRDSFNTARLKMANLKRTSERILGPRGTIHEILRMLDNPESARLGLRTETQKLQRDAQTCATEAEAVDKSFTEWLEFAKTLVIAIREGQSDNAADQEKTEQSKVHVTASKKTENLKKAELQRTLETLRQTVTDANDDFQDARMRTATLEEKLEKQRERSWELAHARYPMPTKDKDPLFYRIKRTFFRQDSDDLTYDKKRAELYYEQQKRHADSITKAIEQRAREARQEQEEAMSKLQAAQTALMEADAKHRVGMEQLLQVELTLNDLDADLMKLDMQKSTLQDMLSILRKAITNLGHMKIHVNKMTMFFRAISSTVNKVVLKNVEAFLGSIDGSVQESGGRPGANVIEQLRVRDETRMKLFRSSMEIHAHFYLIREVSALYLTVSQKFIEKALDDMEAGSLDVEDGAGLKKYTASLKKDSQKAQEDIRSMVEMKRDDLQRVIELDVREAAMSTRFLLAAAPPYKEEE